MYRDAGKLSDTTLSIHDDNPTGEQLIESFDEEPKLQHIETDFEQNEIDDAYESIKLVATTESSIIYASEDPITFPIPRNILINGKLIPNKSSSYYRQNDERLESDTETEQNSLSFASKSFNSKNKDDDPNRIRPKQDVDDPVFEVRPSDRLIRLGESVKFSCKVVGTRPLEVFWFKMNGDELINNEKYEIYHDDEFYYLKIFNTSQRDAGMYLCVISNEKEQNIDSFNLQLRGAYHYINIFINIL